MGRRYALAGNPNSGKTTLFNALTGSNQYVGNWPGVTVERKEGKLRGGGDVTVIDLPGIYSLSPYSGEDLVTRNYILEEKPELIINIVDATNLERNLYLSLQLSELGLPTVLALNMIDLASKRGDFIDVAALARLTGFNVVPISAAKEDGVPALLQAAEQLLARTKYSPCADCSISIAVSPEIYTGRLKQVLSLTEALIRDDCFKKQIPLRWAAVKLIEGDGPTRNLLRLKPAVSGLIEEAVLELERDGTDREIRVAEQKYHYIAALCQQVLRHGEQPDSPTFSDKIDKVLTNRFLAIPLFLLVMLGVFYITFGAFGARLKDAVEGLLTQRLALWVETSLLDWGAADWLTGLICGGVITGLGSVLAFLPQIALLFLFLSLLEDSGYMARGAFIMDRALRAIGLSGSAFVPMLMGFGCSVPALMATRALRGEKDRRLMVLLLPYLSCSAKMPFYSLMISAFFDSYRGLIVFAVYLLGILTAVACALLLQKTLLRGEAVPFVMELPPYRLPTLKTLRLHLWEKIRDFLSKASTVLLLASVLIWLLQYFDRSFRPVADSEASILGLIGKRLAPLFAPLGFGDWKSVVAMLSGLLARESIVSTLGILHGSEDGPLTSVMRSLYTPPAACAFMSFSLLFLPCVAALAAIRREMNSLKWTAFALGFQSLVAWTVSFLVYQTGNMIYIIGGIP